MGHTVPFLIISLGACSVFCLSAAITWYFGVAETLLPGGRDTKGGAIFMAICGGGALAVAAFLLLVRNVTEFSIYPTGVRRYVRQWWGLSSKTHDAFLLWDDIAQISADELVTGTGRTEERNPRITLRSTTPIPAGQQLKFDAENEITVMAHQLVAEPNTLLSLLRFLKDNPDQRDIVARPDARELLTPPPLRERFHAARLANKAGSDV